MADKDVAPDIAEDGAVIPSRAATDEGDAASDNPFCMDACLPDADGEDAAGAETCGENVSEASPAGKKRHTFWRTVKGVLLFVLSLLNPKNLFSGKMISIDFILHRWKTLLTVFILLMFYISNRYSCQQKVSQIGMLRKEVEELGYRSLDMFVRLKRLQKEESVFRAVQDSTLNLHYPDIPPYIILDKDYGSE